MIEVGKYNCENTNADFDSDLVVEGVVLELQSLSSLLKIGTGNRIIFLRPISGKLETGDKRFGTFFRVESCQI